MSPDLMGLIAAAILLIGLICGFLFNKDDGSF